MRFSLTSENPFCYRISKQEGMRVEGPVFANEKLMASIHQDQAIQQVMNVAKLPGIVGFSYAMPDIHWGKSSCQGVGRILSRTQAKKNSKGRNFFQELAIKGIQVQVASKGTLAEEMPQAYKDVEDVVDVVVNSGISKKVKG